MICSTKHRYIYISLLTLKKIGYFLSMTKDEKGICQKQKSNKSCNKVEQGSYVIGKCHTISRFKKDFP